MRVVLISMLVMLMAPRAEACPNGTVCVAAVTRSDAITGAGAREIAQARPAPRSMIQLAIARAERPAPDHLATSLRIYRVPRSYSIQMPWVWQVLRKSVYAKMPRYERTSQRPENRFSFVVSPVVVESPQDTVPGVGLEGGF